MISWQAHWSSGADTGNGPLRVTGYGYSPEEARENLHHQLAAWIPHWDAEARGHGRAVDEARQEIAA